MANVNRKATGGEMARAMQIIREAYPELEPVFGGHSSYGGSRASRDHTISFYLRDQWGKRHSDVIWVLPQYLAGLRVSDVRAMVAYSNGARAKEKRKKKKKRR